MKAVLIVALLGALVAVSLGCGTYPEHKCVKDYDPPKCVAAEKCEDSYKEPCGDSYCEYPYACATLKKQECQHFIHLKEKCEKKKVCKEVKKPCGGGYCNLSQECVKETVCTKKRHYRRSMLQATAIANAQNFGYGSATAIANAVNFGGKQRESVHYKPVVYHKDCGYCKPTEVLECKEEYKCVDKEPCKDVIIKKCVEDKLTPGIDLCDGGYDFLWYVLNSGEKCGDEFCGYGYKCADVVIQKCKTPCGDSACEYGYECVSEYDDECDLYPYYATICRDTYKPVCVQIPKYCLFKYEPPCKVVYHCEEKESVCGDAYCPRGYKCIVDDKRTCEKPNYYYHPTEPSHPPKSYKPHEPAPAPEPKPHGGASATSKSVAVGGEGTYTDAQAKSSGKGAAAVAGATALTENAGSASLAQAFNGTAATLTQAVATNGEKAFADAGAESSTKH